MLSTSVLGAEAVNRVGLDGENKLIAAGQITVNDGENKLIAAGQITVRLNFYNLEKLKWNDYIT